MQDLIKEVVKSEEDANQFIQEARNKAAAMLAAVDAEMGEKIRALRQEEREKTAGMIDQAEREAAARLKEIQEAAQRDFEEKGDESSPLVQKLADRTVERICSTVFDGR